MTSADAVKLGPTDVDPYALDWRSQRINVLRAFLETVPDSDGFDYGFDELGSKDQEEAAELCEYVQAKCPKRIDKPWAKVVLEGFANDEVKLKEREKWLWDQEDSVALRELVRAQDSIKRGIEKKKKAAQRQDEEEDGRKKEQEVETARKTRSQSRSPGKGRMLAMPMKEGEEEAQSEGSTDEALSKKVGSSKKAASKGVPVEAEFTSPDGKQERRGRTEMRRKDKESGRRRLAEDEEEQSEGQPSPVKGGRKRVVSKGERADSSEGRKDRKEAREEGRKSDGRKDKQASPAKETKAQLLAMLKEVMEEKKSRKRGRGRSRSRSRSSSASPRPSSSADSRRKSSRKGRGRHRSSSSSGSRGRRRSTSSSSSSSRSRSRSRSRRSKSARSSRKSRRASKSSHRSRSRSRNSSRRSDRKDGDRKGKSKKGNRSDFYRKVRGSRSYQLHTVLSEVRGSKMEDAKSVSDLFAAWAETAGAQAELESGSESESQEDVQKMLRDARQQLSGDFKQAVGLLPEGPQKEGQVEAAERMLICSLVQSAREQPWLAKMDVFEAANVGMGKVRKFVEKHAYVEKQTWSRSWSQGKGQSKEKGGKGAGRGAGFVQWTERLCFTCGQSGHIASVCPNGGGNRQWSKTSGSQAVPPPPPFMQKGAPMGGESKQE
jgi:hypothetical protein